MEIATDICVIAGFRLTETRRFTNGRLSETIFNIRMERGDIVGRNYRTAGFTD